MNYPNLPNSDLCCGCAACVDTCAKGALSLIEDKNGYYNIVLEKDKCVGCGQCEKHCHLLTQDELIRNHPEKVKPLAGWSKNEELIRKSATGGIFGQIALSMLEEGNCSVFGAALMEDSSVKQIEITSVDELYKLQNSKYQQSYSVGVYKRVKQRLKDGRNVLFSGTPCQVAALHGFLGNNDNLKKKLYTIEVLCHGVPTNYLHRIGLKINKAERIYAYRNKEEGVGWLKGNNKVSYVMYDGSVKVMKERRGDFLFRSYLSFSFSRKGCYKCPYADIRRVSDITLGDFWGMRQSDNYHRYENLMGTSIILPNTEKGEEMVNGCKDLYVITVPWRDFLPYNQNLFMPTNKYLFRGASIVHLLVRLPIKINHIIFQNGFSSRYIDRVYQIFLRLILGNSIKKKDAEIKRIADITLKKMNNEAACSLD